MEDEIEGNVEALGKLVVNLAKSQVPAGKRGGVGDGIQAQAVLEKAAKKLDRSIPGRAPDTELAVNHLFGLIHLLQGGDVIETDEGTMAILCDAYLMLGYVSAKLSRPRDLSRLGKSGAQKRWAPNTKLEAWAVEKYRAKEWPSANQAAHDLKDQVREYGRTIGAAPLSEQNAQRTIAGWFNKANKSV